MQAVLLAQDKKKKIQELSHVIEYDKKSSESNNEDFKIVEVEHKAPPKEAPLWPKMLLITLANAGAAVFALKALKNIQAKAAETVPQFAGIDQYFADIDMLRTRSEESKVDLEDPRLNRLADSFRGQAVSTDFGAEESEAAGEEEPAAESEGEGAEEPAAEEDNSAPSDDSILDDLTQAFSSGESTEEENPEEEKSEEES